jgi:hypothetical protein
MKGDKSIKPTRKDLDEYNKYIKDRSVKPGLMNEFQDESEYEEFMKGYLEGEDLTIKNDKSIIDKEDSNIGDYNNPIQSTDVKSKSFDETLGELKKSEDSFKGFGIRSEDLEPTLVNNGSLIGSLMVSSSYIHLFHLISYSDYSAHMSLKEYYEEITPLVDEIAEIILANEKVTEFINVVFPDKDPINYLEELLNFSKKAQRTLFESDDKSGLKSLMDDVINLITSTLYKLKRLGPSKNFSRSDVGRVSISEVKSKYGITAQELIDKLNEGMEVESEHSEDPGIQKSITLDHLYEDLDYYTKLKRGES